MNVRNKKFYNTRSKYKNKNNFFIKVVFFLILLIVIFISKFTFSKWIKDPKLLPPISKLEIIGNLNYTHDEDIRQLILSLGSPGTFITQNIDSIYRKIMCLSWIKKASVSKQWPDKLKIRLTEYIPVAFWNENHLIDINGHFFDLPLNYMSKLTLPIFQGPEDKVNIILQNYFEMEKILSQYGMSLKKLKMTPRHSWQLILSNDIKINLGRSNYIQRLLRFVEIYPIFLQQMKDCSKKIHYVDLRYDSGAAVRWISKPL